MTHRRIAQYIATLTVAALTPASSHAQTYAPGPGTVEVLVSDRPLTRHLHNGRTYVEAAKGREYAIRLRNPYGVRVAVALSVDGLNTIDAKQSTATEARKWVLDPYQTVTIRGWQTSRTEARRFEFTSEERSYGAALGKTTNLGVISAVYFREKAQPVQAPRRRDELGQAQSLPAPAPASPPSADARASGAAAERLADTELAATGMGDRTDHAVTQVWLELEDRPAHTVDIRYEYRAQLVKLGVLPSPGVDPLARRERARGFEPEFAPVPPRFRQ